MRILSAQDTGQRVSPADLNRLSLILLTLLALALRLWALAAKGLSYDEAATALMARATPLDIILFHWNASFEHPPFWQLLMYAWSKAAGQSEFSLRVLPALAGTLLVPLIWQLARALEIGDWRLETDSNLQSPISNLPLLALFSTLLVVFSPVLLLYSQEARMYTLVVALALASLLAGRRLMTKPSRGALIVFLLINWTMLGLHYYSVLLLAGEFFAFAWVAVWARPRTRRVWPWLFGSMLLAVLPLLCWMAFAPGFRITAQIVLQGGGNQPDLGQFLADLWRDLAFGAIRWQPPQAALGDWLLPLLALGIVVVLLPRKGEASPMLTSPWAWLPLFVSLTPIVFSALLFRTLATRYILFVAPLLYVLTAVGIRWLWQLFRPLGMIALAAAGVVAFAGITYYFGPYEKSEYREMAAYLTARLNTLAASPVGDTDTVLLEAPRQHLLAKYYLPAGVSFSTAPAVVLPAYWPISAPPVVPEIMDGQLQNELRKHHALWLVLTAENEVDLGEFVPKYLTAVAYKVDCRAWLDVSLCYFVSPHFVKGKESAKLAVRFANELLLKSARVSVMQGGLSDEPTLFVQLNWRAETKPTLDYRVTLRLVNAAGKVVAQRDDYPIGPLLPPSTWNAADEKPGFMALPIPAKLAAGAYQIVVGLYDPSTTALVPYTRNNGSFPGDPLVLGLVDIGDTITVRVP